MNKLGWLNRLFQDALSALLDPSLLADPSAALVFLWLECTSFSHAWSLELRDVGFAERLADRINHLSR